MPGVVQPLAITNSAIVRLSNDLGKVKLHSNSLRTLKLGCLGKARGWYDGWGDSTLELGYGLQLTHHPAVCGRRHKNDVVNDHILFVNRFLTI
jgi:hypothetical protein